MNKTKAMTHQPLTVATLLAAYRSGELEPAQHLTNLLAQAKTEQSNSWLAIISEQQLSHYLAYLDSSSIDELPLFGIPFAIKDNIDLAGLPTTAACKEYAYEPERSAFVVQKLIEAGAVPLGKTNLDQFATGLVGTRSPWGAVNNSFDPEYISGGSSSGSAVTVASGQVCFSLGTDTAGSGRVPAAFNNILGMKASKGMLSCSGVVPACRSLDCVTLFAHTTDDLNLLLEIAGQYDGADCYARDNRAINGKANSANNYQPDEAFKGAKIGVPMASQLAFFGNVETERLYQSALEQLNKHQAELVEIDFQPFLEAAKLLYEGPWVAERFAAIEPFFSQDSSRCLPVIETIIGGAQGKTAADTFKAIYKLQEFKQLCDATLAPLDAVIIPTAGTIYRIDEVEQDPIGLNSNLGYYTNFMNLLDYAAIALPAGMQGSGLPFGITLFGPAWSDRKLLSFGAQWQQGYALTLGATGLPLPPLAASTSSFVKPGYIELAVCGAHLEGLALNHQLIERQATLLQTTQTASCYRLYALAGGPPMRPGLIRDKVCGTAIKLETWAIPLNQLGSFLQGISQPLGLGKVELADGRWVTSFICEGYAISEAEEITEFGGWRAYLAKK